tara:strand:- start:2050 stop:2625 length:576 start_codon:yes stop_codon:yes gene_type:complete
MKICIIGNKIIDKKLDVDIDNYDKVIRFNTCKNFEFTKGKTDIIVMNNKFLVNWKEDEESRNEMEIRFNKIPREVLQNCEKIYFTEFTHEDDWKLAKIKKKINKSLPIFVKRLRELGFSGKCADLELDKELWGKIGARPSCGALIINKLVKRYGKVRICCFSNVLKPPHSEEGESRLFKEWREEKKIIYLD